MIIKLRIRIYQRPHFSQKTREMGTFAFFGVGRVGARPRKSLREIECGAYQWGLCERSPGKNWLGGGVEALADFGQSGAGGAFSEEDEFCAVLEVIVAVAGDIGLDHQIGASSGLRAIHILRNR